MNLRDADALMDATEGLEDKQASVLNEVLQTSNQEKVIHENHLTLSQLLLGTIEVKLDVETHDKLCDGIFVGVGFLKKRNKKHPTHQGTCNTEADSSAKKVGLNVRNPSKVMAGHGVGWWGVWTQQGHKPQKGP